MLNETVIHNPFPGLRAFEEDEDVLFFGREKQVDELLTKLRSTRFLAVIGSSGSGKSSLVKSGLIPALHSGFMSGAGSLWRVCSFRPGIDPIGNLARSLASYGVLNNETEAPDELAVKAMINESILRRSGNGLVEAYKQSGTDVRNNLLILVDQFEEIFRFSKYEIESKEGKRDSVAFINLLIRAAKQTEVPVYVVFTMRSDFLSDCTEFRGLPEAINDGDYLVPRMTREERRDAIVGPIAVAKGKISQRLLNQLLNDVGDNPDQLPILQHAMMRTWEIWKNKSQPGSEVDLDDYEQIGTMKEALSQHAEEAYAELVSDNERRICEVVFKALTDKGSESRGVRAPRLMSELCKISNSSFAEISNVINVFRKHGRGFLMPPPALTLQETSVIDISHESLMRVWKRLITWVEEENQSSQIYLRLCQSAELYEQGRGGLWRDPELQVALKWKNEQQPNEIWAARYNNQFEQAMAFLEYSNSQFTQELIHKENLQKRRLKQAKRVVLLISAIAIVALFLSVYSFEQKNRADKSLMIADLEKRRAEEQRAIALEQQHLAEANKAIALQEKSAAEKSREQALFQKEIAENERRNAEESNRNALLQKNIAEDRKAYAEKQKVIAEENATIAKEQQELAVQQRNIATINEQVAIKEKKVSSRLRELAEARNLANQAMLLINENNLAGSSDLAMKAYEMNRQNEGPRQNNDIFHALHTNWEASVKKKNQFLLHKFPVRTITGRRGSLMLLSGDESGTIIMSRSVEGVIQPLARFKVAGEIRRLALSPDGKKLLVLTASGTHYLYACNEEKQTIAELSKFTLEGAGIWATYTGNNDAILLSTKGLAQVSLDNNVVEVRKAIRNQFVSAIARGRSGKLYIATISEVKAYKTWDDVVNNRPEFANKISGHLTTLSVDEQENYIAAGTAEGGIWIKNLVGPGAAVNLPLHLSAVNALAFSRNADNYVQLATAGADQMVKLVDVEATLTQNKAEDILLLKGHNLWVYALYYQTDGKYLFSASEDQKIISWIPDMSTLHDIVKKAK